jgi:hypothetical protein
VPKPSSNQWERKFESKVAYRQLLKKVFESCAKSLKRDAVIYVRTDARKFTLETTRDILTDTFPQKRMYILCRPYTKATQTALYGDKTSKPGEIDIVMR